MQRQLSHRSKASEISKRRSRSSFAKVFAKKISIVACIYATSFSLASSIKAQASPAQTLVSQRQNTSPAPLDLQQFSQLVDLAALNTCYSVSQKIEYKQAAIVATASLFTLIRDRYKGQVQAMPPAAQDKTKLNQWIAGNILLKAVNFCPTKLPKEVVSEASKIRAAQKR